MRVLVADDDPIFLALAKSTLEQRTDHDIITAVDGSQALELALQKPIPDVLVLDWQMPKMSGTQVCRLIRSKSLVPEPYVLFVTSRVRREETIECLSAGADDLLTKPVAPDVLVSRIELARQKTPTSPTHTSQMRDALFAAAKEGKGDLVVRSGSVSGRVFFHRGQVAWAHLSDGGGTLLDLLVPQTGIDHETARAAVEECRRTGATLTDTLVAWGLADRAKVRETIRLWTSKKLKAILQLPNAQSLFVPCQHEYAEDLVFPLEDLLDPAEAPASSIALPTLGARELSPSLIPARGWNEAFVPALEPTKSIESLLERIMSGDGAIGVAALDRASGLCLGRRGVELPPDVAWSQIHALNTMMRDEVVQDSMIATETRFHLLRAVPSTPNAFLYALFDAKKVELGAARLHLKRVANDSTSPAKSR